MHNRLKRIVTIGLLHLVSFHAHSVRYSVEVYSRVEQLHQTGQQMALLTGGGLAFSAHSVTPIGFPAIQGELATLFMSAMTATGTEEEPQCIESEKVLYFDWSTSKTFTTNIQGIITARLSGFNVLLFKKPDASGFYTEGGGVVDTGIKFASLLSTTVLSKKLFKRDVYTSQKLEGAEKYLLSISDYEGTGHKSLHEQLKVGGEYSVLRDIHEKRITVQQLFRTLINTGSDQTIPVDSALSDDLFHIIYGNRVEICFTESTAAKRTLKVVVHYKGSQQEFVILITGEPESEEVPEVPEGTGEELVQPTDLMIHFIQQGQPEAGTQPTVMQQQMELQPIDAGAAAGGAAIGVTNF